MGTNYYACPMGEKCPTCGTIHGDTKKHIGKSSGGWCFSLHIYPKEGINTLDDWVAYLSKEGMEIQDEYDETQTFGYLMSQIRDRSWVPKFAHGSAWSEPGPNGCSRHKIDGIYCVGHGEGTWDYLVGDFR